SGRTIIYFINLLLKCIINFAWVLNRTARFISRFIKDYQVETLGAELVDCRRPRMMNIGLYNLDAQMWRETPNPKWYPIKRGSAGAGLQVFVCSTPGN
ncbi:hypothetical protein MEO93_27580, partial [Dolichospermum sp. ST_sed3]|nr:hypothetical protein [Dolichospermum sp. ST_sed3]